MRWAELLVARLEKNIQDWLLYASTIALVNGDNNNVDLKKAYLVRITGPTSAFAVTGLAGGATGKIAVLYNTTAQGLTIKNQSTSSSSGNRITTMTGADLTMTGPSAAFLVYSLNGWILVAYNPVAAVSIAPGPASIIDRWWGLREQSLGTTTIITDGGLSQTASGTASNQVLTEGHFIQYTSSTVSCGWIATSAEFETGWLFDCVWVVRTPTSSTDLSHLNWFIGFDGAGSDLGVSTSANMIAFRYSPTPQNTAGDTTWKSITTDSGNTIESTTLSTPLTSTVYVLRIKIVSTTSIEFYMNNVLVATHSVHLPTSTTQLFSRCRSSFIAGMGQHTILWNYFFVTSN